MLYDLQIWLAGLLLSLPVVVICLAWPRIRSFYLENAIDPAEKLVYQLALVAASLSALAYLGYWGWRVCQLYRTQLPFTALLALDRLLLISRLLSPVAIFGFLFGRGPYRILAALSTSWIAVQIWVHGGVIH
jgi:hypothetical protein